jgi:protein-L-isoaspartate O-methyltransferase
MDMYTATYSPDDNKLRLYAAARFSKTDYDRVKSAGFRWAPKQDLFFATWSPTAEDLCLEFAGEIDDEDKTLADRAEERADRFENYSEKRLAEAEGVKRSVDRIADAIPFGQPILVGHHSERRARKDAARIQNGMAKAVKLWETSEYWQSRAAGAVRHAKYKELPGVRARLIKTIEADLRKQQRGKAEAEKWLRLWNTPDLSLAKARHIANFCWLTVVRPTTESPGGWTAYDVLKDDAERYAKCPAYTVEQVQAVARQVYPNTIARHDRWIKHYENRLSYERAMLGESGGIATDQKQPEKGGACKCWASRHGGWSYIVKVNKVSVTVLDNWGNGGNNFTRIMPFDKIRDIKTAAEVQEYLDTEWLIEFGDKTGFVLRGTPPEPRQPEEPNAKAQEFLALKEQAKQGVEVVAVDQLFITPLALAERVIEAADIQPGQRVLEPSAGMGNLLVPLDRALAAQNSASGEATPGAADKVAVEINPKLVECLLRLGVFGLHVHQGDFLHCNGDLGKFDRVVMNPPFVDQADIDHVTHALNFLKPGGKLVAIMSAGASFRQDRKASNFRALIEGLGGTMSELPEDSFKQLGTNVRTVLVEVRAP